MSSARRAYQGSTSRYAHVGGSIVLPETGASNNWTAQTVEPSVPRLSINQPFSIPTLTQMESQQSPLDGRDDLTSWLFNDQALNILPFNSQPELGITDWMAGSLGQVYTSEITSTPIQGSFPGMPLQRSFNEPQPSSSGRSSTGNLLSQHKRDRLIEIMQSRFTEVNQAANYIPKDEMLTGNYEADTHVLSMHSMQLYIGSYWFHYHAQMPILHKPTFSADKAHPYLLLAIMIIGASCLEEIHGAEFVDAAARFANFVAWNLRWQIFMDAEFQPPARLWVLQAMLLLEVYEKQNATRALHERSHIHSGTTLTLMRRGTSLTSKASKDILSPSINRPGTRLSSPGTTGSASSGSTDEWWVNWITAEATRRAAFAAFVMDSVNATIFGHAASMSVHEIRLPLPCDEALWSATSAAEVARVESSLYVNNIKPTTFLDALKRTLSGKSIKTNSFGRMIVMAGLLSVSWHMHQADLQTSSLNTARDQSRAPSESSEGTQATNPNHDRSGATSTSIKGTVPANWRVLLGKAFDSWKRDFDHSILHFRSAGQALGWQGSGSAAAMIDSEKTSEALGSLLFHLSHIAIHIDIADCQILAGRSSLQGRPVTPNDYERTKKKMTAWAKSKGGRVSVFHSICFLKGVLLFKHSDDDHDNTRQHDKSALETPVDSPAPNEPVTDTRTLEHDAPDNAIDIGSLYSARSDPLLLRPWIVYYATLTIWCYCYALDGPFPSGTLPAYLYHGPNQSGHNAAAANSTLRDAYDDTISFFDGPMGSASRPEMLDVVEVEGRRKGLVGLMRVATNALEGSRWELLVEARERLVWATGLLKGDVGQ